MPLPLQILYCAYLVNAAGSDDVVVQCYQRRLWMLSGAFMVLLAGTSVLLLQQTNILQGKSVPEEYRMEKMDEMDATLLRG